MHGSVRLWWRLGFSFVAGLGIVKESKTSVGDEESKTIVGDDGVHPRGGKTNDDTEDNMSVCGYALRNWVNLLVVREIYFHVLIRE